MASVCFYFQVHQPDRLGEYRVFDVGGNKPYFDNTSQEKTNSRKILEKVARKSYRPANRIFLRLLQQHPELKLSFSFSGVFLEQLERYDPETLASFQALVDTGRVEVLAETHYHSLAFFFDRDEFAHQVNRHKQTIERVFGVTPQVIRNTELAYNNQFGRWADEAGYKAVLAEGWDENLGWRSPNFVYRPPGAKISLLLKNYRLSDDIAFRFSREDWEGWPLTAEKFANWVSSHNGNGEVINLFMDYETFGEHQWRDTGIFEFLEKLPGELLKHPDNTFHTPVEVAETYEPKDVVDMPDTVTWADTERDLSAWMGNRMQQEAAEHLYNLKEDVLATRDPGLIDSWRRLQTSDHFYYMCTKWAADGDVHAYFNPHESPYEAFINYMNVLRDLKERTRKTEKKKQVARQ